MNATIAHDKEQGEFMSALKQNGRSFEIVRDEPIPQPKLYDPQGNTVAPAKPTLMSRLNEKSKDDVTVTKGMLAFAAIALTALGIFLGYVVPGLRDSGRESEKILSIEREVQSMSNSMNKLDAKFDEIQKGLTQQAIKDAEKKGQEYGYKIGRADKEQGH